MKLKRIVDHPAFESFAKGVFAGAWLQAENGGIITKYDLGALSGRFLR